jgi:hypothetical protein
LPYLSRSICLHVLTDSHQQEAHGGDECHNCKALRSSPDIQNLGGRQLKDSTKEVGHDANDCNERMLREVADNIRSEVSRDLLLERIDEIYEEDAVTWSVTQTENGREYLQDVCRDQ